MKCRIRDTTKVAIMESSRLPAVQSYAKGNHHEHDQHNNEDPWCAMTSDQQRADRKREDQREERKREQRRLDDLRLERLRRDRERDDSEHEARRQGARAADVIRTRQSTAASQARVHALLSNPASYIGGQVPNSTTALPHVGTSPKQSRQSVRYPSAPIPLHAGEEHHHPDVTSIFVEVLPQMGGGIKAGIDWAPRFGRALVTAPDLPRSGWQQHRCGDVRFPIELRRTREGMSLRWLAPTSAQPTTDQKEVAAVLLALAASAVAAGWRTWRVGNARK